MAAAAAAQMTDRTRCCTARQHHCGAEDVALRNAEQTAVTCREEILRKVFLRACDRDRRPLRLDRKALGSWSETLSGMPCAIPSMAMARSYDGYRLSVADSGALSHLSICPGVQRFYRGRRAGFRYRTCIVRRICDQFDWKIGGKRSRAGSVFSIVCHSARGWGACLPDGTWLAIPAECFIGKPCKLRARTIRVMP